MAFLCDRVAAAFDRDRRAVRVFEGLSVLDVGCGGGLLSEPMARLGARVTGLDASDAGIDAARAHARLSGFEIDYRVGRVEDLAEARPGAFDVVVASEVIEHVADTSAFMAALSTLARPGGLVAVTTINRTVASLALAKIAAEYVLGWVPRGTHDWRQFVTPGELEGMFVRAGLDPAPPVGIVYRPWLDTFELGRDDSVNYAASARKR